MSPGAPDPTPCTPDQALTQLLARLPGPVRPALALLAQALLPVLRPPGVRPGQPGAHSPEGIEGTGRRGPWDRLRHSEWALLDTLPDVFTQRAIDGELQFLQLARTGPRPPAAVVVLLDSGPRALGAPRVVQAAALLASAAHATAQGLPLLWGPVGGPATERRRGLGPTWLRDLRRLRSLESPSLGRADPGGRAAPGGSGPRTGAPSAPTEPRAARNGDVPPGPPTLDLPADAWSLVVHSRRRVRLPLGVGGLEVLPDGEGLALRWNGRPLTLPQVSPELALAVLRPPTARTPQLEIRGRLPAERYLPWLCFSASGARLLVRARQDRVVIAIPVPGRSRGRVHSRELWMDERFGGAGWVRQRLAVLIQRPGKPWTVERDLYRAELQDPELVAALEAGATPLLLVNPTDGRSRKGVMLLPPPPVAMVPQDGGGWVAACAVAGTMVPWTGPIDRPARTQATVLSVRGRLFRADPTAATPQLVTEGHRVALRPPCVAVPWGHGALAFARDRTTTSPATPETLRALRSGARPLVAEGALVGVVRSIGGRSLSVLTQRADALWLTGPAGARPLALAAAVQAAATSPDGDVAAWVDTAGRLTLWHAVENRVLQQSEEP